MLYYHNPTKQLYIDLDISKEFGFRVYIYYIKEDNLLLLKAFIGETTLSVFK